jgi:hypothetical protein
MGEYWGLQRAILWELANRAVGLILRLFLLCPKIDAVFVVTVQSIASVRMEPLLLDLQLPRGVPALAMATTHVTTTITVRTANTEEIVAIAEAPPRTAGGEAETTETITILRTRTVEIETAIVVTMTTMISVGIGVGQGVKAESVTEIVVVIGGEIEKTVIGIGVEIGNTTTTIVASVPVAVIRGVGAEDETAIENEVEIENETVTEIEIGPPGIGTGTVIGIRRGTIVSRENGQETGQIVWRETDTAKTRSHWTPPTKVSPTIWGVVTMTRAWSKTSLPEISKVSTMLMRISETKTLRAE